MIHNNPQNIILKPVITEKSIADQAQGKYYFWVANNATKAQITKAFEAVFSLKPLKVNTLITKGKIKTDWKKHHAINKPNRKKAVITVAKDKKIDLLTLKNNK
jgi:large subunit ribosomal protein L23